MDEYSIVWRIDVAANSPRKAALEALEMQQDPDSTARVFEVTHNKNGELYMVDLQEPERTILPGTVLVTGSPNYHEGCVFNKFISLPGAQDIYLDATGLVDTDQLSVTDHKGFRYKRVCDVEWPLVHFSKI